MKKPNTRKKKREKWEWNTTTDVTNVVITIEVTEVHEIPKQLHVINRGKQAVVTQRDASKKDHKNINYEEISRRNQFSPLRIQEGDTNKAAQPTVNQKDNAQSVAKENNCRLTFPHDP